MKVEVSESGSLIIKEVYQGFIMETSEGNQIAICMRDDTFEINIMPKGIHTENWHRIDMQSGTIKKEHTTPPDHYILCPDYCKTCTGELLHAQAIIEDRDKRIAQLERESTTDD